MIIPCNGKKKREYHLMKQSKICGRMESYTRQINQ